ncbi:MAG: hypothetical protein ACRD35_09165 [Candidatus Acidiferrales bacterium]
MHSPLRPSAPAPAAFAASTRPLLAQLSRRPGLVFIHGHPQSSRLAHYFLLAPLLRGETVLLLDAANCFNPYKLADWARRSQRPPEELLERVRLSRAFTCFQLAELIERTPAAARRYGARRVVLTGLPDIFDEEEVPAAEVKEVFSRSLERLRGWPGRGLTALMFSDAPAKLRPLRRWLDAHLTRCATSIYRFEEGPTGLQLLEEKQGARVFLCASSAPSASSVVSLNRR